MYNKEWLVAKRKEKELSQARLSKLSGVAVVTIQAIEQGLRQGSNDTWKKLIEALNEFYTFSDVLKHFGSDKFEIYTCYNLSFITYYNDLSANDFEFKKGEYTYATATQLFRIKENMKFIKEGDEFIYDDQTFYVKVFR